MIPIAEAATGNTIAELMLRASLQSQSGQVSSKQEPVRLAQQGNHDITGTKPSATNSSDQQAPRSRPSRQVEFQPRRREQEAAPAGGGLTLFSQDAFGFHTQEAAASSAILTPNFEPLQAPAPSGSGGGGFSGSKSRFADVAANSPGQASAEINRDVPNIPPENRDQTADTENSAGQGNPSDASPTQDASLTQDASAGQEAQTDVGQAGGTESDSSGNVGQATNESQADSQDQSGNQSQGSQQEVDRRLVLHQADQVRANDYERIVIEGRLEAVETNDRSVTPEQVDLYVIKGSALQMATVLDEGQSLPGPDPRRFYIGTVEPSEEEGSFRAVVDATIFPGDSVIAISSNSEGQVLQSDSLEVSFGSDGDLDGINDAVEASAPFGGDANRDGVPDSLQPSVTSVPTTLHGDFVTLDAQGAPLRQVRALPSRDTLGTNHSLPYGMFEFEVLVQPGGAAQIQIILPESAQPHAYYKQDEIGGTLVPFRFDGQTGAVIEDNVITVHLVDGGRGDADGIANGVIVDPGTPVELGGVITLSGENAYQLSSWDVAQHGGSPIGQGLVSEETQVDTRSLTLHEGDSLLV
ncbi:MAG: hypothetical protein MI861_28445, partial [Pirellulales bacterium]|nr:hypothetical protein [Pirellulales bacterium]